MGTALDSPRNRDSLIRAGIHYIVKSSRAKMPSSCWGHYGRVALLKVEAGIERVSMISPRARGVIEVVKTWEKLHLGKTERCAFERALREAENMAAALNKMALEARYGMQGHPTP